MPNFDISQQAIEWLASGERGVSSEFMFYVLTGIPAGNTRMYHNHPCDVDDFKRCEKLLRKCPEFRDRLGEMCVVSKVWASLVDNWDKLVDLIEEECPGVLSGDCRYGGAPMAYHFMKNLGC
jgi:hypothetical protein